MSISKGSAPIEVRKGQGEWPLDRDVSFQEEVRNAAFSLVEQVKLIRAGRREPDEGIEAPRPK